MPAFWPASPCPAIVDTTLHKGGQRLLGGFRGAERKDIEEGRI
jgi:hypothetical protein